jgi:hypothetical protein
VDGSGTGRRGRAAEDEQGFGGDPALLFLQWLAEQGSVATLSVDGTGAGFERRWVLRVLEGDLTVEGATVEQCLRIALPQLREAGLRVDEGLPAPGLARRGGVEGAGVLVLDWLADQGVRVFLKADGARAVPGWTFLVQDGPLPRMLRVDGPRGAGCISGMLARLGGEGLVVPV